MIKLAQTTLGKRGIRHRPGHYLPALVLLESDGAQNRGTITPPQAARQARAAGIRVDGVGLGTPTGTENFGAGTCHEKIPVPPDPHVVQLISNLAGGQAFTATTAQELRSIYRQLGTTIAR